MSLSPSETKDLQDVLSIYGSPNNQTIPTNMLGPALRAMKLNPLEREIISYITEFDRGGSGSLTRNQLVTIYLRKKQDLDTYEQLFEAFKFLNKDNSGFISVSEFKYYMCKMGETMTEVDVDDVLKTLEPENNGKINIEKFARALLNQRP